MQQKNKKSFAVFLLLCFVLTLLPMTVFAEGEIVVSPARSFPYAGEENNITITGGEANATQTVRISGYRAPWYVTDGLVLHLDGIYNAGVGVHDNDATEWLDLSGQTTGNLTVKNHTWIEKGLNFSDTSTVTGVLTLPVVDASAAAGEEYTYANGITVEEVLGTDADSFPATNNGAPGGSDYVYTLNLTVDDANAYNANANPTGYAVGSFNGIRKDGIALYYNKTSNNLKGWNWVAQGVKVDSDCYRFYFTDDGNGKRNLYTASGETEKNVSATNPNAATVENTKFNLKTVAFRKRGNSGVDTTVSVNALRMYNRNLSSTEIAQNAATDKLRYDTEGYNPFLGTFNGKALVEQFDAEGNAYIEVDVTFDANGKAVVPLVLNNKGEETLTFTVNGKSAEINLTVMAQTDAEAARAVEAAITALPNPEAVTADNFAAIRSADGGFAALTEVQKNAVSAELVQKLADCKAKLDETLAGNYQVTLTYDANGGALPVGTDDTVTVTYKSTTTPAYSLAVPSKDRYVFAGWYWGDTQVTDDNGIALAPWDSYSNATVTAKWEPAGTEAVPYEIADAEDIYALARILATKPANDSAVDAALQADYARFGFTEGFSGAYTHLQTASYLLKNGITLTNHAEDVSNGFHGIPNFMGHFDGDNHTITLDIDFSKYPAASRIGGVFADVKEATIENIVLDGQATGDFTLNPNSGNLVDTGLLVGYTQKNTNKNTVIRNITNNATINTTLDTSERYTTYIAAMVGRADSTLVEETGLKLENCVNNGDFTVAVTNTASNGSRLGGLIGHIYGGTSLENCRNNGDITATGARIHIGDLGGSGSGVLYKNCVSAGNVTGTEENVAVFAGMSSSTEEADGNYIRVTVAGKAGQKIRLIATNESYTFAADGEYALQVPVFYKDEEKQGAAYLMDDYIAVGRAKLYWFNLSNKMLMVNLRTEDATTDKISFSSWAEAIPLDCEEDFIMMQKAINDCDEAAIRYLYNKAGIRATNIDNGEAQVLLRSAYYKLTQDVTIDDALFTGIGTPVNYFGGHFDGGKHTVTLNMNQAVTAITGNTYYGLFGYMQPLTDGVVEIKDLNLVASWELQIPATNFTIGIGSVAGRAYDLTLNNVNVTVEKMDITADAGYSGTLSVGGAFGYENNLIGDVQTVTVKDTITVQSAATAGDNYIGGFAGSGDTGGNVIYAGGAGIDAKNSHYAYIGGIIGYSSSNGLDFTKLSVQNTTDGVITFQCAGARPRIGVLLGYNTSTSIAPQTVTLTVDGNTEIAGKFAVDTASATGDNSAGGLVGRIDTSGTAIIKDVVVSDNITVNGQNYAGGFIGYFGISGAATGTLQISNSASAAAVSSATNNVGMLLGGSGNVPQYTTGAYIKTAPSVKAIGNKADSQEIAIDVTGLNGTKEYSDKIALFGGATPAALAVAPEDTFSLTQDGKLSLDKVGTAKASFTWNGVELYTGEEITVTAKELTNADVTITGLNSSYPATGSEIKPAIGVLNKDTGDALTAEDYDVSYANNTEAGTATVTVTFKGNYRGTATANFVIVATEETFEVLQEGYTGTYDKAAHGITVTVPDGATVGYNKDGSDTYTLTAEQVKETNAGTYVVYFKAEKDGKTVTGSQTIIIEKAPLVITAEDVSIKVNAEMPTFSYSQTGLIDGDVLVTEPTITTTATNTATAGTYAIKASGADAGENYTISYVDGTLKISRNSGGGSSSSSRNSVSVPSKVNNGTVTVSPTSASKNMTVTVTATPDEGYEVDSIVVRDKDGNKIKLTNAGNNKYTFTMPDTRVDISISFAKATNDDNITSFSDVKSNAWYAEAVEYVTQKGMMQGVGGSQFAPNDSLTRGMIAQVLYNLENKPGASSAEFNDVLSGQWYADAVNWAAGKEIVKGYENGGFGPNDAITREQLAAILYRYADVKGYNVSIRAELSGFNDANKISGYAQDALAWAVGNGIVKGNEDNTIDPTGNATRAEVAMMLMRFCEAFAK